MAALPPHGAAREPHPEPERCVDGEDPRHATRGVEYAERHACVRRGARRDLTRSEERGSAVAL